MEKLAHKLDLLKCPVTDTVYGEVVFDKEANIFRKLSPLVRKPKLNLKNLPKSNPAEIANSNRLVLDGAKGKGIRDWWSNRFINTRYGRNISGSGPKVTLDRAADGKRTLTAQTQRDAIQSGQKMPVNKLNKPIKKTDPSRKRSVTSNTSTEINSGSAGTGVFSKIKCRLSFCI